MIYEAALHAVAEAIKPLGARLPHEINGKGWIQHSQATVLWVKTALLKIVRPQLLSHPNIIKAIDEDPASIHPRSVVARILDDLDSPAKAAWNRLGCIDEKAREHNQPFFAINGPRAEMVCMEDRR